MTDHHYLILKWAEEPGCGTFTNDLDWELSHPKTCEWYPKYYGEYGGSFTCPEEYEIQNVGESAFGLTSEERRECWSSKPAAFPVEFYCEKIQIGWSVEYETGIRMVEE